VWVWRAQVFFFAVEIEIMEAEAEGYMLEDDHRPSEGNQSSRGSTGIDDHGAAGSRWRGCRRRCASVTRSSGVDRVGQERAPERVW
jgi:hypothetical protein